MIYELLSMMYLKNKTLQIFQFTCYKINAEKSQVLTFLKLLNYNKNNQKLIKALLIFSPSEC